MFQGSFLHDIAWFTKFPPAFWIPIQSMYLSKWQTNSYNSCYVALCIDCLHLFWKLLWIFGNANPWFTVRFLIRIMLIRIPSFKNDSCISSSSLEFLQFDFLSDDGGATTWTIFMCNLSSLFYRCDKN